MQQHRHAPLHRRLPLVRPPIEDAVQRMMLCDDLRAVEVLHQVQRHLPDVLADHVAASPDGRHRSARISSTRVPSSRSRCPCSRCQIGRVDHLALDPDLSMRLNRSSFTSSHENRTEGQQQHAGYDEARRGEDEPRAVSDEAEAGEKRAVDHDALEKERFCACSSLHPSLTSPRRARYDSPGFSGGF
jgi:hypothetical protein